ncbi:phosphatidylglycerophosphatase A [Candidatus Pelagibacter sp.]|nr:phosphatidylglycerophosphatase A [Candidatus Pelagibacter sp.]
MKKINVLISTFFGYGYLTKMPGTVTSFITTVFIYTAYEYLGYTDLKFSIIFFTLLFFYSFYAVKDSESEFKNKDPRQIVIDEVLGQAMPLILILYLNQTNQISLQIEIYYVLSFLFFRFFDIIKPFPVSYFDKNFKNYFGIIMDDIMAGLYSMLLIYIISLKF